jgi:hypothetical protein
MDDPAHDIEMVASYLMGFRLGPLRKLARDMPGHERAKKVPLVNWIVLNNLAEAQPLWEAARQAATEVKAGDMYTIKSGNPDAQLLPHLTAETQEDALEAGWTFLRRTGHPADIFDGEGVKIATVSVTWHRPAAVAEATGEDLNNPPLPPPDEIVITGPDNANGVQQFWNTDIGWTVYANATRFTSEQREETKLPAGGSWTGLYT